MLKKILIVEDYVDTRDFLKFMLENEGYEVVTADDGQEAVQMVKSEIPHLILMDLSLPFLDGFIATQIIREFLKDIKVPIIALTAYDKSYYPQAINAGCNDLITKPIVPEKILPIVKQYLAGSLPENKAQMFNH